MTIVLGMLELSDLQPETPEVVVQRIRAALHHVPPARLSIAPDCGMKFLLAPVAARKLRAMVLGTALVMRKSNGSA